MSAGHWHRLSGWERRETDIRCWRLRGRNYSWHYVASVTGYSVGECKAAVQRVESGRYGEVDKLM